MKILLIAVLCLAGTIAATPREPAATDPWASFGALLGGTWTGEGSGEPGVGSGGFSFRLDLQGKIMIRRNTATYPPADITVDSIAGLVEYDLAAFLDAAAG